VANNWVVIAYQKNAGVTGTWFNVYDADLNIVSTTKFSSTKYIINGIVVDSSRNIYFTRNGSKVVYKYDDDISFLANYTSAAESVGQVTMNPYGYIGYRNTNTYYLGTSLRGTTNYHADSKLISVYSIYKNFYNYDTLGTVRWHPTDPFIIFYNGGSGVTKYKYKPAGAEEVLGTNNSIDGLMKTRVGNYLIIPDTNDGTPEYTRIYKMDLDLSPSYLGADGRIEPDEVTGGTEENKTLKVYGLEVGAISDTTMVVWR